MLRVLHAWFLGCRLNGRVLAWGPIKQQTGDVDSSKILMSCGVQVCMRGFWVVVSNCQWSCIRVGADQAANRLFNFTKSFSFWTRVRVRIGVFQ